MRFEYHSFVVEPFLKQGNQPVFMFSDLNKTSKYYTLSDPDKSIVTLTTGISDAVRIPVFALVTADPGDDAQLKQLTHGSLLLGVGLETSAKFFASLPPGNINRIIVVVATNCHELTNSRYRAYLGMTAEMEE